MKHSCIKAGPDNQKQFTAKVFKTLHTRTKLELQICLSSLNASPPSSSASPSPGVSEVDEPLDHPNTNLLLSAQGTGAAIPTEAQFTQQTDFIEANPGSGSEASFNARPLFSPFDSGGLNLIQARPPLWSMWPTHVHDDFWPLNNMTMDLGGNTVPYQQPAASSPEVPFEL